MQGLREESLPEVCSYLFRSFDEHNCSSDLVELKYSMTFEKNCCHLYKKLTNYLKRVNINKSPGPAGMRGRTLTFCADQLSGVFQQLFQTSLDTAITPTAWTTCTVIPVPNTNNPKEPNDYRPVALTYLVIKTMEKLVKSLIVPITVSQLDPLQFAYRAGRGVEDAKLLILDKVYINLEKPTAHDKILFAEFSSAFNLTQRYNLTQKLIYGSLIFCCVAVSVFL